MSTPQSMIYICSGVRLDNRYEHSIYFPSDAAQQEYFAGKVVKTFSAYSYLRKTWPIQVEATMEQAKTWSYLYFRNGTGKYYYYFINQVEYKNDHMVELTLELDVLQTYLFDFDMLDCFVERQHTETDEIGEHTLDEGLELGAYTVNDVVDVFELASNYCVLVMASINPRYVDLDKPVQALGNLYNRVFSGLGIFAIDIEADGELGWWTERLEALSEKGYIDGIIAMWMYPKALIQLAGEATWEGWGINEVKGVKPGAVMINGVPSNVGGYFPDNKKLLTYPYTLLYATNNNGGDAIYRFERFGSSRPVFNYYGALSPDADIRLVPFGYNGTDRVSDDFNKENFHEGISLSGFPTCAWDADVYKMWLAQNQAQHKNTETFAIGSMVAGAVVGAAGVATGNIALMGTGLGLATSGYKTTQDLLAQKKDAEVQPPQARGTHSANVNVAMDKHTFSFLYKSISAENAKIIDDYFTMYGYKLNQIRTPNLCARPSFTYIKTVGCNIKDKDIQHGMCTEDRVKITGIFDRGITFWRDGDRVADYSQNNLV